MKDLSNLAAKLHVALRLGTLDVGSVVGWAEQQISESDLPALAIIELASMDNANPLDVFGKLGEVAGEYDLFPVLRSVLADAHELLQKDISFGPELARSLYAIYIETEYDVPPDLQDIAAFESDYALAAQGTYGTREDVDESLLQFTLRLRDAA